jgi:hypothetical protein
MYPEDYSIARDLENSLAPHDEDDEEDIQREMMAEAGQQRPDSIDFMRDGDTRHFYNDTLPMGGDDEPY